MAFNAKSKKDKALDTQLAVHKHISLLADISSVADQLVEMLCSKKKPSKCEIHKAAQSLKTISAVARSQAAVIREIGKLTAAQSKLSHPRTEYVAKRLQTASRAATSNTTTPATVENDNANFSKRKSEEVVRLDQLTRAAEAMKPPATTRPKKKQKKNGTAFDLSSLPSPAAGPQYSKREAVDMLLPIPIKQRSRVIDSLIEADKIPLKSRSGMTRIMKSVADGKPWNPKWGSGRLPLMQLDELQDAIDKLQQQKGDTVDREDIRRLLKIHADNKASGTGHVPKDVAFSAQTVGRYHVLAAVPIDATTRNDSENSNEGKTEEVSCLEQLAKEAKAKTSSRQRKEQEKKKRDAPFDTSSIPLPAADPHYSKREAVDILLPMSMKHRTQVINAWIETDKIPLKSRSGMTRIMKSVADRKPWNPKWGGGRLPLMRPDELQDAIDKIQQEKGVNVDREDIRAMLKIHADSKAGEAGHVPNRVAYSEQSVTRYRRIVQQGAEASEIAGTQQQRAF